MSFLGTVGRWLADVRKKLWHVICACLLPLVLIAAGALPTHFWSDRLWSQTKEAPDQGSMLTLVSIIYAVVSAFVAIMIPLHYQISLDILDKAKREEAPNARQENKRIERARMILGYYIHTAEPLIYSFGIFGLLVLLEEARVVSELIGLDCHLSLGWPRYILIVLFALMLAHGVGRNWQNRGKWGLDKAAELEYRWKYCLTYGVSLVASGIWIGLLFTTDCPRRTADGALFIVAFYYLWWIVLRDFFAPLTNIRDALDKRDP